MTIKNTLPEALNKEHFYVNRKARQLFHLTDPDFLALPSVGPDSLRTTEKQAAVINEYLKQEKGEGVKPVLPAQLHGMKLLHELFHFVMARSIARREPEMLEKAYRRFSDEISLEQSSEYLARFLATFPTINIFTGSETPAEALQQKNVRLNLLEESFLVWLNNQNPALEQFSLLISDSELMRQEAYRKLILSLQSSMQAMGPVGPDNEDLAELLTRPMRHAPDSILEQLRYIRLNWSDLLEGSLFWSMLSGAIELIEDEDKYLFFQRISEEQEGRHDSAFFDKDAFVPDYTTLGDGPANYSSDSTWMPEVVMLAKSTYVWLDQLGKTYGRAVHRLQDIPDEELDRIAGQGFTALWLIGLWQRSHASREIKQMQGNPEAKASAYALEKYDISDDIGGYEGYLNLRHRAMQRGIRLASDMVPNHTGMDSELVRERPDWFLSATTPPYYNYSYTGPNLSPDPRYTIQLEDGYWNRTDAAVTFKRIDHMNGDTRFIYHGNDGTNMPWNDTAQLNFLSAEVREAVIQQILHVARMFPIIRFDAAMVLAKRHIQRLWFPLHGHSAAVPSRSAYAMSNAEFDAAIPEEFWREVVDRIHAEVPDTLLLAEAFWMLEGYFVRTLGMHRVYNSAFMHMLKKEDNASYRYLIKNTLEFDPEILKRYVNFMNNPDEDTAIAQFGRGDKYIGVCIVMLTVPGLPMFGHGQVEGFTEKYGMEYAKAYYDEHPDEHLVWRHYQEIFPIMKKRPLFAEVQNFYLYDVYSPEGSVNENVFAYSNMQGDERALVIYNNSFERATGWLKTSVGYLRDGGIRQSSLGDGLDLGHEADLYVIFRDHACGLEFIRSAREIRENGLFMALDGYKYNVFLDFRQVRPSRLKPYDQLARELDGRGTQSVERDVLAISLSPLHRMVQAALESAPMPSLKEADAAAFQSVASTLLTDLSRQFSSLMEKPLSVPRGLDVKAALLFLQAAEIEVELANEPATRKLRATLAMNEEDAPGYGTLVAHWILLDAVQEMLRTGGELQQNLIDDWLLQDTLRNIYREGSLCSVPGEGIAELMACLAAPATAPSSADPASGVIRAMQEMQQSGSRHLADMLQLEEHHQKHWFREHRFSMLTAWLTLRFMLTAEELEVQADASTAATPPIDDIARWTAALESLDMQAFLAGYELGAFFKME
ncbi:alpha-amylase family glycosyl hydrolase [Pelodictyon luteolum]|uniref:Alpha amylase, catalytic subdomain n=1 Tax=Chlorobium luteolum (strain DSM 273 / BCRC 81028 / 2530) TaxID=319225 RepID=Q3B260_CHLL3|nr:alpha-amylase family glycosyl hydrolase [Pelodictyon luteolum]ABB24571.1 Alpha amylase, catalytic subdomain [Pelodictyon luteolum DSM 273]